MNNLSSGPDSKLEPIFSMGSTERFPIIYEEVLDSDGKNKVKVALGKVILGGEERFFHVKYPMCSPHDRDSFEQKTENLEERKTWLNKSVLIIVGASGAGKTTMVNEAANYLGSKSVPMRAISRPARNSDNTTGFQENLHLIKEDFLHMIKTGEIPIYWTREMEKLSSGETRTEKYGFLPETDVDREDIVVFSGNNALLEAITELRQQKEGMDNIVVMGIYSEDETREKRLWERSKDIKPDERSYRLQDSAEKTKVHPGIDLLLNNSVENQEQSKEDFKHFLKLWTHIKNPAVRYLDRWDVY